MGISPGSGKRLLDDVVARSIEVAHSSLTMPISPQSLDSKAHGSPTTLPDGASRQASPALSVASTLTSMSATPDPAGTSTLPGAPPAKKRRKLTPAERQVENERKDKERAEKREKQDAERRVREELKQVKDEEKRRLAEEREEKKRKKELEVMEKEEAKRKVAEELAKKEAAQFKISKFFVKPKLPAKPVDTASASGAVKKGIQDSILTATLTCPAIPDSSATSVSAEGISDFDQVFFPFALPSHATCAPTNLFSWDKAAVQHLERTIGNLGKPVVVATAPLAETLYAPPVNNPTNLSIISVRTLVSQIADSASRSSDPTGSSTNELCNPLALLRRVPLKYIYFHHDIRPPYLGTHTKFRTQAEAAKLTRNPLKRVRVELEYDYDSEAEWQEPDEGDEVESNAESEDESTSVADPDEMDDFLDDEGTGDGSKIRRKLFTNDMKPICTGIYWEDPKGQCKVDAEWNHDPRQYRMEIIHANHKLPIDPFSTAYWEETLSEAPTTAQFGPQRLPLQARPNGTSGVLSKFLGKIATPDQESAKKPKTPKASVRLLEGEELAAFKKAVEGSELKKIGLLSVLKTQFPKVPNEVLKDTLSTCAARVGAKEADKRWRVFAS